MTATTVEKPSEKQHRSEKPNEKQQRSEYSDLLAKFSKLVEADPTAPLMHFVNDKGQIKQALNRSELDLESRQIAALLRQNNLQVGDRVLLVYSFSLDVVPAILACFSVGVIPCPAAPPNPMQLADDLSRFEQLASDSGCLAVLTNTEYARFRTLANLRSPRLVRNTLWKKLKWIKTDGVLPDPIPERHKTTADDIALLQYTSGSTSNPKGVMVTFNNLKVQIELIRERVALTGGERSVLWIPYYHDHCLVGFILNQMFHGGEMYLMSPLTFIKSPATWFEQLEAVKATCTAAPNFAFSYAVRKTTEAQRSQWDLSAIEVFQSGGEPVTVDAVDRFSQAFAVTGLKPETVLPAFGIAEHVLGVAVNGRGRISIDRTQYEQAHRIELSNKSDSLTLLGNGAPLSGVRIEIVEPDTREKLALGDVGEIWVDSASKAAGYWNLPEFSAEVFNAQLANDTSDVRFLRTGDLGFLYDGELYVSGRIKDTIIIRGRNIFPHDVEAVADSAHEKIRRGRSVAFTCRSTTGGEQLGIVTELKQPVKDKSLLEEISRAIRQSIARTIAVTCHTVVLVNADTTFKTTSGKLQRSKTRQHFLNGGYADRILFQHSLPVEDNKNEQPAPSDLSEDALLARMVKHIAAIDGSDPGLINCDAPLQTLALDSLASIGLVLDICDWSGRDFPHELFTAASSLRLAAKALSNYVPQSERITDVHAQSEKLAPQIFPPNPSQAWMLEPRGPVPNGWTVGGMVQAPEPIDDLLMQKAFDFVVEHHDSLRLRLIEKNGTWKQHLLPHDEVSIDVVNIKALGGATLRAEIEEAVALHHQHFDITEGPVVRLVVFHLDKSLSDRLLLSTHHLTVDAYALELIASDLLRVYEQLKAGTPPEPLVTRTLYADWMKAMTQMVTTKETEASIDLFDAMPIAPRVVPDNPQGLNNNGNAVAKSAWLSAQTNELLLRVLPNITGLSTATLVLTSLLEALYDHTGESQHGFELVHHGRKDLLPDIDLSLTCGWVSINCPFTLCVDSTKHFLDSSKEVQASIDQIPRHGLDYGLLRYMHPDDQIREKMKSTVQAESKFMWYGQNPGMLKRFSDRYPRAPEVVATGFDPNAAAHYLRYFYGTVSNGGIRLDVMSSNECFADETRENLLQLWLQRIEALHEIANDR